MTDILCLGQSVMVQRGEGVDVLLSCDNKSYKWMELAVSMAEMSVFVQLV